MKLASFCTYELELLNIKAKKNIRHKSIMQFYLETDAVVSVH